MHTVKYYKDEVVIELDENDNKMLVIGPIGGEPYLYLDEEDLVYLLNKIRAEEPTDAHLRRES